MKLLVQSPSPDEPFTLTGFLTDLAALAAIVSAVAAASAFLMGAF